MDVNSRDCYGDRVGFGTMPPERFRFLRVLFALWGRWISPKSLEKEP
jgi:hypothetical protein